MASRASTASSSAGGATAEEHARRRARQAVRARRPTTAARLGSLRTHERASLFVITTVGPTLLANPGAPEPRVGPAVGARLQSCDRGPGSGASGYLDAASSEPLHPAARDALLAALDQGYADPRRLHARRRRPGCCSTTPARPSPVRWACGRRGDVHRLAAPRRCTRAARAAPGPRGGGTGWSTRAVEHSAVLHAAAWWRRRGGDEWVGVDRAGGSTPATLARGAAARSAWSPSRPPTTRSARCSRSAGVARPPDDVPLVHGRLRLDGPAAPARRLGRGRRLGAQVGRARGRRRAARPQGGAVAQPVPRRRPRRRAGDRLRERPGGPRRRGRTAGGGGRARRGSTRASTRSWTGAARVAAEVAGRGGRRRPRRAPAPPGDLLLPVRRRRGAGDRARPPRLRRRERLGLHRLDARAQPRAGGDGRADPRQRAASRCTRDTDRRRRRRLLRRPARGRAPSLRARWACDRRPADRSTSSSTAAGCGARCR